MVHLSIVIPAYNERNRLPGCLRRILEYLEGRGDSAEVIVSDDASGDGTPDLAREILAAQDRVPWRVLVADENGGKGRATRIGLLAAEGRRLLFTDADLSTPIEQVGRLEAALDDGYDVAIGSRGLPRSDIPVRQPFYREGMGRVFNLLVRIAVLPGFCDTQCGFKLFTREAGREIFSRAVVDGFAFDVEALRIGRRLGYRVAEVPVRWLNSPETTVSLVGGPLSMLADLVRIRFADRGG